MSRIRCCVGTCKAPLEGQPVVEDERHKELAHVTCPRDHRQVVQGETRRHLEEMAKGDLFARAQQSETAS